MGKKLGHRGRALRWQAALLLLSACGADANGDATTARSPAPETEPAESAVQPGGEHSAAGDRIGPGDRDARYRRPRLRWKRTGL